MPPSISHALEGAEVRYPVVLRLPRHFEATEPRTWPRVEGRLEFHEGELRYMPPCADEQGRVAFSVVALLAPWVRRHRQFVGASNEAGMVLGGSVRAADGALWRRDQLTGHVPGTLFRVPPVLAVEVAGQDEEPAVLREKAQWYLGRGVTVVWLVYPESRSVEVVTAHGADSFRGPARLAAHAALPGLTPRVREFFAQLEAR